MINTKIRKITALLLIEVLCTGCASIPQENDSDVFKSTLQQENKLTDKEDVKKEKKSINNALDENINEIADKKTSLSNNKPEDNSKNKKIIDNKVSLSLPLKREDETVSRKEHITNSTDDNKDEGQKIENEPVKSPNKPTDNTREPENKPSEKPIEKPNEKPNEKPDEKPLENPSNTEVVDALSEAIKLVNQERQRNALPLLTYNTADLLNAANIRAGENAKIFDHIRPNGKPWNSVLEDLGIKYHVAGENLYYQYNGSYVDAVEGWMNSSGHYANMMNPNVKQFSIGKYGGYYTMLLTD